jgi:hypothetical protein
MLGPASTDIRGNPLTSAASTFTSACVFRRTTIPAVGDLGRVVHWASEPVPAKQRGVQYSCVNHARLDVNGEYYGMYANVERVDREYPERHFDDPDGNLWKEGRELTTKSVAALRSCDYRAT